MLDLHAVKVRRFSLAVSGFRESAAGEAEVGSGALEAVDARPNNTLVAGVAESWSVVSLRVVYPLRLESCAKF